MAKLDIVNLEGQKVGDLEVDDYIFGAEVKEHLLWEVVKQQLASRRAGTHSTLRRDEVRGGGKKPFRQKGTGRARQGSSRAPNHVGGGKVFTPKPRDYSYLVPRKVRQAALRSALSLRATESRLIIVDSLDLAEPKTKHILKALEALKVSGALVVDGINNSNLEKSVRNLASSKFLAADGLNVYDILKYQTLILGRSALSAIQTRLGKPTESPRAEGAA